MIRSDDYEGDNRRKWHVDRTVNIGHVLTTVIIAGSMVSLWFKMDTRLALLEQEMQQQRSTNTKHESTDREIVENVREALKDINSKLDRLIWDRNGSVPPERRK